MSSDMKEKSQKNWSYDWLCQIGNELRLYPIQFANLKRLEKNDAVFIFDEVGSGKTICSGLMAMHYLFNHMQKKVRVITINALAGQQGQFFQDWKYRLPMNCLGVRDFENQITVTNNHCASMQYKDDVGLLIIDEAHLFLNKDTQMFQNLVENIHAEKIVFLTATPIKNSVDDLEVYQEIARKVLGREENSLPKPIKDYLRLKEGGSVEDLICCSFDESAPITRYYKDTIKALTEKNGQAAYQRQNAMRHHPEVWWSVSTETTKQEYLMNRILDIRKKDAENNRPMSKFIVFTRLVKESYEDGSVALLKEFKKIRDSRGNEELLIELVSGDDKRALHQMQLSRERVSEIASPKEKAMEEHLKSCPDILIMTYTIAEQGVNLPEYNYVINYHIPANPASLEQRFGRVDRLDSPYQDIHMIYLLEKGVFDTSRSNFYNAMDTYRARLVPNLPSKNCILSGEILKDYEEHKQQILKNNETLEQGIRQNVRIICSCLKGDSSRDELNEKIISYVNSHLEEGLEISKENILKIADDLSRKNRRLSGGKNVKDDAWNNHIIQAGDNIFYFDDSFGTYMNIPASAMSGDMDAASCILNNERYREYCKWFDEVIKPIVAFREQFGKVNRIMENMIMNEIVVTDELISKELSKEEKQLIPMDAFRIFTSGPAAKILIKIFKYWYRLYEEKGESLDRIGKDYFEECIQEIKAMAKDTSGELAGCSPEFRAYISGLSKEDLWIRKEDKKWKASYWYKLIYTYGYFCQHNADKYRKFELADFFVTSSGTKRNKANSSMNPGAWYEYSNYMDYDMVEREYQSDFDDIYTKKIFNCFRRKPDNIPGDVE